MNDSERQKGAIGEVIALREGRGSGDGGCVGKGVTTRTAVAQGFVRMAPGVMRAVQRIEESQGGSAGSGADCGNCGCQEYGGVDTSLSSSATHAH